MITQRNGGEWSYEGLYSYEHTHQSAHPSLRKLERVIAKLEPLSDQHAVIRFLRNIDNAKALTGFVQELGDAITDYQVRAASITVIFNEHLVRFRYNKGCTRGQGKSMMIPRTSTAIPRTS
jgi:hypothetical protein